MSDQDGGSSAAQGAPADPVTSEQRGLFSRLIEVLGVAEPETEQDEDHHPHANGAGTSGAALGLVNLRRMRVEDVMIPRAEIVSVPVEIKKDDLVEVFRESGLTRLPVYKGTLDTPIGMIHLKDFTLTHGFNGNGARYTLRKMLRPVLYAPPSMPIGVLLQKMQTQRTHMALVIDEYGGVDGLVTIEDLIEQVIGEIEDEHDMDEGRFWTLEKPGCYLAAAKTPLEEFEAELGRRLVIDEEDEELDTLGGLVFKLAGRVPVRGEVVPHPNGPEFEVVDADPRRIKRLRVRLPGGDG